MGWGRGSWGLSRDMRGEVWVVWIVIENSIVTAKKVKIKVAR